jgi:hypothetical protein
MKTNRYAAAGWASILSAAGTLAMLGLSLVFDLSTISETRGAFTPVPWTARQLALVITADAAGWLLGIYALVRFRDLVRERYDSHAIDHLIWVVIGAGLLTAVASHGQRLFADRTFNNAIVGVATLAVLGVLNGVIGIVFATRLQRLNGNLNGYKKPLVSVYLAGSICFLLVVPSLVGIVLFAAWSILLGLAFFQGEELEELEVV